MVNKDFQIKTAVY